MPVRSVRFPARATAAATAALLASPTAAHAVDKFEIQVYEADVNRPGQLGLEVHTNYTLEGRTLPEYAGEIPPHHAGRMTLEPALGVTEWLELGAYLQAMVAPGEGAKWAGAKLRAKLVVPPRLTGRFFFGINLELGRVPKRVEEQGWANEFRPILGYDDGWILAAFNPIFGYALTGPDKLEPDFEPAGKLGVNTQQGFSLGLEYYAGLGPFSGFPAVRQQEHLGFVAFDLAPPAHGEARENPASTEEKGDAWELNVGVGHGFTEGTPQQWIVKTIVGRSF